MLTALSWGLGAVTILFAMGVVAFESAKRSTTCLLLTAAGAAVLVTANGAVETGAALFWLASSSSMLLLVTALLLNLTNDDIGRRRLSIRRTVACLVVAYFAAATAGMFFGPEAPRFALAEGAKSRSSIGDALFGGGTLPLLLLALSLLALIPAALLLARKQA